MWGRRYWILQRQACLKCQGKKKRWAQILHGQILKGVQDVGNDSAGYFLFTLGALGSHWSIFKRPVTWFAPYFGRFFYLWGKCGHGKVCRQQKRVISLVYPWKVLGLLIGRQNEEIFSLTFTDHNYGNGSEMEHSLNSAVYCEALVGESWWAGGPFALLSLFMYLLWNVCQGCSMCFIMPVI